MTLVASVVGYGLVTDTQASSTFFGTVNDEKMYLDPDGYFGVAAAGSTHVGANFFSILIIPLIRQWLHEYYSRGRIVSSIPFPVSDGEEVKSFITNSLDDVQLTVITNQEIIMVHKKANEYIEFKPIDNDYKHNYCVGRASLGPGFVACYNHHSVRELDTRQRIDSAWELLLTQSYHIKGNRLKHYTHDMFKPILITDKGDAL